MEDKYSYTEEQVTEWMEVAKELIMKAGDMIKNSIGKAKDVSDKTQFTGEGNSSLILTETDQAVEKMLISGLKARFPDHRFIGEESDGAVCKITYTNNPTWIIDPIDGTMNFVHSNPLVCTSIGLAVNKKIIGGLVNCPIIGKLYTAVKGRGSYLNGTERLQSSGITKLRDAMILMELPSGANDTKKNTALANITMLMAEAHAVRCPGPAATDIAWIGSGSADGFFHFGIHCWDMAAGALIITEAGGCVLNPDGSEFNLMGRQIVAAASEPLAREIVSKLKIYPIDPEYPEHCPI